jgi:hypothetical protein
MNTYTPGGGMCCGERVMMPPPFWSISMVEVPTKRCWPSANVKPSFRHPGYALCRYQELSPVDYLGLVVWR